MTEPSRPRALLLIPAAGTEPDIPRLLSSVPPALAAEWELECLVMGEGRAGGSLPPAVTRLTRAAGWGHGDTLKVGIHFAIERGFAAVAVLGSNPEAQAVHLPRLLSPLAAGVADVVSGSRLTHDSGLPFLRRLGNGLLTGLQNRLARSRWTDVHSGVRAYATAALKRIPYPFNSSGPEFDAEVAIQVTLAGLRHVEIAIPASSSPPRGPGFFGALAYVWAVGVVCVKARAQELSLFFDRKFDCVPSTVSNMHYKPRLGFESTHTLALERIPSGARVLDIGCAGGDLGRMLRERGCLVTGVDRFPLDAGNTFDAFHLHDLNQTPLPVDVSAFDYAAMLDVLEHLQSPETFVDTLKAGADRNPALQIILSTPNIAFIVSRLMLLAGQFNYGKRGILDLTHTRLFTFGTFRRLFEQSGFEIVELRGVPAPFPLALGDTWIARTLLGIQRVLIKVSRSLFAFQIFAVVRPRPGLGYLMNQAARGNGGAGASQGS